MYVFTYSDFNILCVRGINIPNGHNILEDAWEYYLGNKNGRLRFRICLKKHYTT